MRFTFFRQVWQYLIRPYWTSEEKWSALGLLLGHLVFMGIFIALTVRLNFLNNDLFTALQKFDKQGFFAAVGTFCLLAGPAILSFMAKHYLLQHLEIRWRRWMTHNFLERWMKDRRYYKLQLEGNGSDNPDQRIAEDITSFITQSLQIGLALVQQVSTLFSFLGILWSLSGSWSFSLGSFAFSIPGYMCYAAFLYALFGTGLSFYFGRSLITLDYESEKREANFRYGLVRFRENSESIAFYQGEERERGILGNRFSHIVENFYAIVRRMLLVNVWTAFYGQVSHLFPFFLVVPKFFAKAMTLGDLMQTTAAFAQVSSALSFIISNFSTLAHWRATTNRLLEFAMILEHIPPSSFQVTHHSEKDMELLCESITLPQGPVLKDNLNTRFKAGEDTLIMGPTGIGKSTLLRVAAGLWPYGQGDLKLPRASTLFLPQKPYMPLGTLAEVLSYPHSQKEHPDLVQVLESVGLGHFAARLYEVNDWARVLSLGEQQRLSIARALLVKPDWLFMDEATSSMDERAEAHMYGLLKQHLSGTTLISVGHRESLKRLHARSLWLGEPQDQDPSLRDQRVLVAS